MSDANDEIEDSSAPLIEHLAELRTRLIRCVIAFFLAICIFFISTKPKQQQHQYKKRSVSGSF